MFFKGHFVVFVLIRLIFFKRIDFSLSRHRLTMPMPDYIGFTHLFWQMMVIKTKWSNHSFINI